MAAYWIVAFVVLAALFVLLLYFNVFHRYKLSVDPGDWGAFGDYVGGIINPIVGIATVTLIFLTLILQKKELQASLEEIRRAHKSAVLQGFEQSLFSWLANYHSLLAATKSKFGGEGRQALTSMYEKRFSGVVAMQKHYLEVCNETLDEEEAKIHLGDMRRTAASGDPDEWINFSNVFGLSLWGYREVVRTHRSELDAVFRTLYRLLRWIDTSELDDAQKWHYVALVRAQLSWIELVFILYNTLTPAGEKFARLANDYALFDNLEGAPDEIVDAIASEFTIAPPHIFTAEQPPKSWPFTDTAFSSDAAKAKRKLPPSA
ncbi:MULTISPECIES: putative phage abortive infection protein [unclassified Variovorax]